VTGLDQVDLADDSLLVALIQTFECHTARIRVCKTEDRYPDYPEGEKHVEIALIGRSNAGKSSILAALLPKLHLSKAPKISALPGQTRAIHFIQLQRLTIVDLPGYGYAVKESKISQWDEFTRHYLSQRTKLRRVCVLIDSRHGLKSSDLDYFDFLEE
jgi:GTP-binding protein